MNIGISSHLYVSNGSVVTSLSCIKKYSDDINLALEMFESEIMVNAVKSAKTMFRADIHRIPLSRAKILYRFCENYSLDKCTEKARQVLDRVYFIKNRDKFFNALVDSGAHPQCSFSCCNSECCLSIDHIKPISRGGDNSLNNMQFLCIEHNFKKGVK